MPVYYLPLAFAKSYNDLLITPKNNSLMLASCVFAVFFKALRLNTLLILQLLVTVLMHGLFAKILSSSDGCSSSLILVSAPTFWQHDNLALYG